MKASLTTSLSSILSASVLPAIASLSARVEAIEAKRTEPPPSTHAGESATVRKEQRAAPPPEDDTSEDAPSQEGFGEYAPVLSDNPHFGVKDIIASGDSSPRRYSMYGDKSQAILDAGKQEGGGTLGLAYSYSTPTCTFQRAGIELLASTLETMDPECPQFEALTACLNTFEGVYEMANEGRSLLVEKIKSVRPGASEYDKAQAKHIVRTFAARDEPTADMDVAVKKIKKQFAASAARSDMFRIVRAESRREAHRGDDCGSRHSYYSDRSRHSDRSHHSGRHRATDRARDRDGYPARSNARRVPDAHGSRDGGRDGQRLGSTVNGGGARPVKGGKDGAHLSSSRGKRGGRRARSPSPSSSDGSSADSDDSGSGRSLSSSTCSGSLCSGSESSRQ